VGFAAGERGVVEGCGGGIRIVLRGWGRGRGGEEDLESREERGEGEGECFDID